MAGVWVGDWRGEPECGPVCLDFGYERHCFLLLNTVYWLFGSYFMQNKLFSYKGVEFLSADMRLLSRPFSGQSRQGAGSSHCTRSHRLGIPVQDSPTSKELYKTKSFFIAFYTIIYIYIYCFFLNCIVDCNFNYCFFCRPRCGDQLSLWPTIFPLIWLWLQDVLYKLKQIESNGIDVTRIESRIHERLESYKLECWARMTDGEFLICENQLTIFTGIRIIQTHP